MAKDTLERAVGFLQKRDGTDKALKILRYSAKLVLALQLLKANPEAARRLKSFESSVGTSRKALRLGKFLQDVNDLRNSKGWGTGEGALELLASGGEGVYYFIEQFIWLVKAGAINKSHGPRLQKLSASFELIGYVGSVTLKAFQFIAMLQKEAKMERALKEQLARRTSGLGNEQERSNECDGKEGKQETESGTQELITEQQRSLDTLRFKRILKLLSLIQDLSDSLLAVADVIDEPSQPKLLRSPAFLAAAGLFSALISAHKNWVSAV